jgi:DinB superfamily
MTPIELMAETVMGNLGMLKMTLSDLSDADLMTRPTPNANHAIWQLGHLAGSYSFLLGAASGGRIPAVPVALEGKFGKEAAKIDDPASFAKRSEIMDYLDKVNVAAAQWIKTLKPEDLTKPSPVFPEMLPTVGNLVMLIPSHLMMHTGQFQVLRRKLGKPILF